MKQVKLPKILNQIATGPKTEPIAAVPWSWEIVQKKKNRWSRYYMYWVYDKHISR